MKKLILTALSIIVAFSSLAGCTSSSQEVSVASTPVEETGVKLVAAAANNGVGHLNSILASTAGFYQKEGLDVEMYYNPSNPECTQALLDGKVDLVSAASTCVLNYIDLGEDIVIIGGQMTEGASLFSLPDRADEFGEINAETLAGKKIGVTRLQSGDIALRSYLSEQGVDLSSIEFVELDSCATIIEAIKKGEVDLGSLFLTFRQTAEAQGLVPVKHLDELYPGFICCRIYTTRENLEEIRANFKAVFYR